MQKTILALPKEFKMIKTDQFKLVLSSSLLFCAIFLMGLNLIPSQLRAIDKLEGSLDGEKPLEKNYCLERISQLDRDNKSYLEDVNILVNNCMVHYWNTEETRAQKDLNLWIPPTENYILNVSAYFIPKLRSVELYDVEKIIERGVGLCSQFAILLDEILEENGYQSSLVGLDGHVVVQAHNLLGERVVLDPDYGVFIPKSMNFIKNNTSIIKDFYPNNQELLTQIYRSPNYIGDNDYHPNHKILRTIIVFSYYLIWIFPVILILLASWVRWKK